MARFPNIIYRWNWWSTIVSIAVYGLAWGLGQSPFVAIAAAAAAAVFVAVVSPRGPSRWTE